MQANEASAVWKIRRCRISGAAVGALVGGALRTVRGVRAFISGQFSMFFGKDNIISGFRKHLSLQKIKIIEK